MTARFFEQRVAEIAVATMFLAVCNASGFVAIATAEMSTAGKRISASTRQRANDYIDAWCLAVRRS